MSELEFVPLTKEELQDYFPQYEILTFIAAGGMGTVYLANQKSIDRKVAIKVLPRELSANEEFSKQFRSEAKVMARVNHPNVVSLFDFGEVEGMLFIVMEFVDGKSLHHSANGAAIAPAIALEITIGLLEGIHHAHEAGILHRDIKPGNILLDSKVQPKIGDFGLARPVEESEAGKVIYGTPGYTAPEVVRNPDTIDERSDIFSIGIILYELLVGKLPDKDNYKAPSKLQPVPKVFDRIVQQAIAPNPDLRYPNTSAFLKELKAIDVDEKFAEDASRKAAGEEAKTRALKTDGAVMERSALRKSVVSAAPMSKNSSKPPVLKQKNPIASAPVKFSAPTGSVTKPKPGQPDFAAQAKRAQIKKLAGLGVFLIIGCAVLVTQLPKILASQSGEEQKPDVALTPDDPTSDKTELNPTATKPQKQQATSLIKLKRLSKNLRAGKFNILPDGTITIGNKAFFLYEEEVDWGTALVEAEKHGGYIACPTSTEISEGLINVMLSHQLKEIWTGGGTTHDLKLSWLDGAKWRDDSVVADKFGVVAMNDALGFEVLPPSEKKKFFIAWDLEGDQLGSGKAQLARVSAAAKSKNLEDLPPGAFVEDNKIFFLAASRLNKVEARNLASLHGVSLATLTSQAAYDKIVERLRIVVSEDSAVWIRGVINRDGTIDWQTQSSVLTQELWLEELEPQNFARSIVLVNKSQPGLKSQINKKATNGFVVEVELAK